MDLGEFIKSRKESLGLTDSDIAEAVGVSRSNVSRWQSGDVGKISHKYIKPLAKILQCDPLNLLWDEESSDDHNNLSKKLFLDHVKEEHGYKGVREASDIIERASALFAGGELDDEDKETFFQSLMEVYLEHKAEARDKFTPKTRITLQKSREGG